ncbi:hypothetical protein BDV28DRAFT_156427 [Aspergillus coremiiformis]|uniref:Uncharacterized protein n=1 Tax=Aspergillus coremiiformis TaxID=138285 RepID=A0A5N6Z958_9EURO|nr:hypothetical protein BDV28DRAFT_156427 [Aspergillus coremiiformis]
MSRRLGRPAKKRDNGEDDHLDHGQSDRPRHQVNRRIRSPRKRKARRDRAQGVGHDIPNSPDEEELILDEITFNDSMVDDISAEETRLPTPPFLDTDKPSLYESSDTIDLSDNWLQEFMSSQPADLTQDRNFLDALGLSSNAENAITDISTATKDLSSSLRGVEMTSSELQDLVTYYPTGNSFPAYSEPAVDSAPVMTDMVSPYGELLKRDPLCWPQSLSSSLGNGPARLPVTHERSNPLLTNKGQRRAYEYDPSSDDARLIANLSSRQYPCPYHEHTALELMQVNLKASEPWPTISIDSILGHQRLLQQLADTLLQCSTCCKTRGSLLMVTVVGIDGLATNFETITSVDSVVMDGLFEYHDLHFRDSGQDFLTRVVDRA